MDVSAAEQGSAHRSGRLESLDAFRGMTIAGMILVNNPGTWEVIYDPLEHAAWHGWTPTDLVFPFFLFIVGVSITLALSQRAGGERSRRDVYLKIIRRAFIIFALGLFLAAFPFDNLAAVRVPGVLQRIAVCYFFASVIFLKTDWRTQSLIVASLLILYFLFMTLIPAPGYNAGDLSMEGNLAAYLDRALLAGHIWKPLYDPEGILSTLPALATALCGVLAGHLLRSRKSSFEKVAAMFVAGAVGVVAGWMWNFWFPINKALWTSSYVLLTAGLALKLLALCYWLIDLRRYRRWAVPFLIFGSNALAVYFLSELFSRIISLVTITNPDGSHVSFQTYVYENLFASWATPINASLMYAVCTVLLWLGLMTILYHKKIFIKV